MTGERAAEANRREPGLFSAEESWLLLSWVLGTGLRAEESLFGAGVHVEAGQKMSGKEEV